jgi:hypothetical protein
MPNSSAIAERPHRFRLLEYFESVAEYPEHSGVWDLNELINEWDMIVDSPLERSAFPCPPYTDSEVSAAFAVDEAREAFCKVTPQTIRDEASCLVLPEWLAFQAACSKAVVTYRVNAMGRTNSNDA